MSDDSELLRHYANEGCETSFTELVRRHVDLVHNAAQRRVNGDRSLAAEVAQDVFTKLAQEAGKLSDHPVLSAWLHTATRNAALNLMISEQRRRAREQEAAVLMTTHLASDQLSWERLRPVLDAAIDELAEPERAVIVLRYLERAPFAQIGAALRITEDAARMRTDRALDKLRTALSHRGISSTAAAIGAIVSGQSLVSAPAGLYASIAAHALAAAGASGIAAFLASLMTTKIVTTAVLTGVTGLAAGGYLGINHASHEPLPLPLELPEHSRTIAALRQQVNQLKAEREQLSAANSKLAADNQAARKAVAVANSTAERRNSDQDASGQITKAVLNNLRQLAAARDQFQIEHRRPPTSLDELVGEKNYIRRLLSVAGETYAGVSLVKGQTMTLTTPSGITVTYPPAGSTSDVTAPRQLTPADQRAQELSRRLGPAVSKAMTTYQSANGGKKPATPEALLPYFATAEEGADFVEAIEAQNEARRNK